MWALVLIACVDAPRRPLQFPVSVDRIAPEVLLDGGTATLTEASVHLADVRFLSAPQTARWSFSLVPTAHAHPGHDFAGDVQAELLGTWAVDLLAGAELGMADAYEGDLESARFQLTDDPSVVLKGVWQGDGDPLPFDLTLSPDDLVSGLPLSEVLSADAPPAGFALAFDPAHALSFVAWTDANGDGALTASDGDTANTAVFGVVSAASWAIGPTEETP